VTYLNAAGSNITTAILSPDGWAFTNMLAPGQGTTIRVIPSVLPLNRTVTLEAFWNPQDPTGVVRDRLFLTPPNTPPTLAAISNRVVLAGQTLVLTNSATDADVPAQTLSFSIVTAPSGATINSNSGVFSWRPTIAQSPQISGIKLKVADNGSPSLSATQSFFVTVNRPIAPQLAPPSLTNGSQLSIQVSGDAGPDYAVETSTNLTSWSALFTSNSPPVPFRFNDALSNNVPQKFYRVLLGP
jgi:hypothetical protein